MFKVILIDSSGTRLKSVCVTLICVFLQTFQQSMEELWYYSKKAANWKRVRLCWIKIISLCCGQTLCRKKPATPQTAELAVKSNLAACNFSRRRILVCILVRTEDPKFVVLCCQHATIPTYAVVLLFTPPALALTIKFFAVWVWRGNARRPAGKIIVDVSLSCKVDTALHQ